LNIIVPLVAPVILNVPSLKVFIQVIVSALAKVITVELVDGKVIVVLSVPVSVKLALAVKVFQLAIVSVEPVAGAVIDILFIDVALATPKIGVISVGLVDLTRSTVPVTLFPN
jgi:hypothetical protein